MPAAECARTRTPRPDAWVGRLGRGMLLFVVFSGGHHTNLSFPGFSFTTVECANSTPQAS